MEKYQQLADQGQEVVEAALAADGFEATYDGSLAVFIRRTGQTAQMGPGLDITGTGSDACTTVDVVRLFRAAALRDDEGNLVCSVPGTEKPCPEGWLWVIAGDVQCARSETAQGVEL